MATATKALPGRARMRTRYEAWCAQIARFRNELPETARESAPMRRLMAQQRDLGRRIAGWRRGAQPPAGLHADWQTMKRSWRRLVDGVELA